MSMFACKVVAVRDGREAVDAVKTRPFDVIFLDVHMPHMGGLESARAIRQFEDDLGRKHTPIVALTASAMPHEQQSCRNHGMDDVLLKPFRLDNLQAALRRWCPA
jgi:CheY-like chemotaxis protein